MINYYALYFDLSKAKIPMKIGLKINNPNPNNTDFQNFSAALNKETISTIKNRGANNNDNTHHPDIQHNLNRR